MLTTRRAPAPLDEGSRARHLLDRITDLVLERNKVGLFAVVLLIVFHFASPYFLTVSNGVGILDQIVAITLVALGYTFILGAGEIDLSITGIIPLTGAVMAKLMADAHAPVILAVLAGLVVGVACGLLNALFLSLFDLPSFVVTLATGALFTGVLYIITNLLPVSNLPGSFDDLETIQIATIPLAVILTVPVAVIFYVLAKMSVFGKHVVALGANREAVRVAGISITRLRCKIFALNGLCCALCAIDLTARSASAQIGAGTDLLLIVIAAVVIGGTPLTGGKADIVGTLVGCLIIGMINNGLTLLGVGPNYEIITQGALIMIALILNVESTRLALHVAKRRTQRLQGLI